MALASSCGPLSYFRLSGHCVSSADPNMAGVVAIGKVDCTISVELCRRALVSFPVPFYFYWGLDCGLQFGFGFWIIPCTEVSRLHVLIVLPVTGFCSAFRASPLFCAPSICGRAPFPFCPPFFASGSHLSSSFASLSSAPPRPPSLLCLPCFLLHHPLPRRSLGRTH